MQTHFDSAIRQRQPLVLSFPESRAKKPGRPAPAPTVALRRHLREREILQTAWVEQIAWAGLVVSSAAALVVCFWP